MEAGIIIVVIILLGVVVSSIKIVPQAQAFVVERQWFTFFNTICRQNS